MIPNDNIEKYLAGQTTVAETEELLRWVNESEDNKKEFTEACKLWYALQANK